MCAGYLFQQDKQYDVTYDTGDKAIQCGRHVDIFKFWLMWKAKVKLDIKRADTNTQIYIFLKRFSVTTGPFEVSFHIFPAPFPLAGHHWV